jgi:hypothetical protein
MRNFAFNFLAFTINTVHWTSIAFVIAVIISAICHNNNVEAMKRLDDE